jgi:predicted XRE-type DNA-binding protein
MSAVHDTPEIIAADGADDVVEDSSGNVFQDLGLPNAEERLEKALLARAIRQIITARDWKQAKAAKIAGIAPSDMSDIVRGKLAKFSLDRLNTIILNLGMDIAIRLTPVPEVTQSAKASKGTKASQPSRRGRVSVELVAA